ncbi:Aste57867_15788 [Aphanomyces stellatus]|uniref:Aste57867_15788 protein n=1 Tax=Aphanomyces stellatus TaxID=120398 RepID=A0A485L3V5_9STRA|nr:hypothetical protein As57867_015732 [Aphanomyces stellatus]VFT92576.1 Aste57867_15788 [Aphanomyces stellatus]
MLVAEKKRNDVCHLGRQHDNTSEQVLQLRNGRANPDIPFHPTGNCPTDLPTNIEEWHDHQARGSLSLHLNCICVSQRVVPQFHICRMMKRRRTADSIFESVLLQPHLVAAITSYQHGLFHDLMPTARDWRASCDSDDVFFVLDHTFVFLDPVSLHRLHTPRTDRRFVVHLAIGHGNLPLVRRYLACAAAAWIDASTLVCAAQHGHLALVRDLHEVHGLACTPDALDVAAAAGHLDVVQYLHRMTNDPCTWRVIYKAAEFGHVEIVQWLSLACATCRQFATCAIDYAAGHDHLDRTTRSKETCERDHDDHNHAVDMGVSLPMPTVDDSLDFLLDCLTPAKRRRRLH